MTDVRDDSAPRPGAIAETVYAAYLASLLEGNRTACTAVVRALVNDGVAVETLYVDLFQRSLYRVGSLWEHRRISVAVEHLATAITERMLTLVVDQVFAGPPRSRSIIVACVADEFHQLGGRIVADWCEFRGWNSDFLGANTPVTDLMQLIERRQPDLLGLSLSVYFNLPGLLSAIEMVRARFPQLPIVVGGQAFRWGGVDAVTRFPDTTHVATLIDLQHRLQSFGVTDA